MNERISSQTYSIVRCFLRSSVGAVTALLCLSCGTSTPQDVEGEEDVHADASHGADTLDVAVQADVAPADAPEPKDVASEAPEVATDGSVDAPTVEDVGAPLEDTSPDVDGVALEPTTPTLNEVACGAMFVELYGVGGTDALPLDGYLLEAQGAQQSLVGVVVASEGYTVVALEGALAVAACETGELELRSPAGEPLSVLPTARQPGLQSLGRIPAGTGVAVATQVSPGGPNQVFIDELASLLDGGAVISNTKVTISEGTNIDFQNGDWVKGKITVQVPGTPSVTLEADFRQATFYPGPELGEGLILVDFERSHPGQRFRGQPTLLLDLHDGIAHGLRLALAAQVYEAVGAPLHRAGLTRLEWGDQDYGFVAVALPYDEAGLTAILPNTAQVLRGKPGGDLTAKGLPLLSTSLGEGDTDEVQALIDALAAPGDGWTDRFDVERLAAVLVAERVLALRYGYYSLTETLLHQGKDGRFVLLPTGLDSGMNQDYGMPIESGVGILTTRCLESAACRAAMAKAAVAFVTADVQMDFLTRFDVIVDTLSAMVDFGGDEFGELFWGLYFPQLRRTLEAQVRLVTLWAACESSPGADDDGDGALCEVDCDDSEPGVLPGGTELCWNNLDEDCNGVTDDGPVCTPEIVVDIGGHGYILPDLMLPWAEARAYCQARGQDLLVMDQAKEYGLLVPYKPMLIWTDTWLGATDTASEGDWVWVDGQSHPFEWGAGEPDGAGTENCLARVKPAYGVGMPVDRDCLEPAMFICEAVCDGDGAKDLDEDGFSPCQGDCDDDDSGLSPGAVDVCSDGVDSDCNGAIDDGPDCPLPCQAYSYNGRDYKFCNHRVTWPTAKATCDAYGMDLLVLDDDYETRDVTTRIWDVYDFDVWLGLVHSESGTGWVTPSGKVPKYQAWYEDTMPIPSWYNGCASLSAMNDPYMTAWPCEQKQFPFVCETPCPDVEDEDGDGQSLCGSDCNDQNPAVKLGVTEICGDGIDHDCSGEADDAASCELGCRPWIVGEHVVHYCPTPSTWFEARELCLAVGGELYPMDTHLGLLSSIMWAYHELPDEPTMWIGVADLGKDGLYTTAWGGPLTSTYFGSGQPDGGTAEACVSFDDVSWGDAVCELEKPFVCWTPPN